uniref:MD-2-related lipid-recognition domain-containing protein n=1 Tax=Biomphalaria glabrata TaxID=6526 RepID=A0A2C9JSH8_BIOGL
MSIKSFFTFFVFLGCLLSFTCASHGVRRFEVDQKDKFQNCQLSFKDCGSKSGSLKSATYNGTCNSGIAVLKRGTIVSIDFSFISNQVEDTLKSIVHGKISDLPFVPFPLDNPDACKDSGLTCPIKNGVQLDYLPVLNVLSTYPSVNVIVKWELQNKAGDDVFCALIPATITS